MKITRHLLLGGIAGPLLFFLTVSIVSDMRPGYDHYTQFISELGESGGQFSSYMNYLGFMTSAILIMLCAVVISIRYSKTTLTKLASILIGVFAIGMFMAGVFSCDPSCLPIEPSQEQSLHNLVSFIAFLSFIISTTLWGVFLRTKDEWSRFGIYSLITAGIATVLLTMMVATAATRSGAGLYQRCFLAALFIWMALFAYRIWRTNSIWDSSEYN